MADLQSVRDELDIQRTKFDYAWACDNRDWAMLKTLFAEDAAIDYSSTGGAAGGRDEVCQWLEESLSGLDWIYHVVSNFQIDLDGDRATSRSMFHCTFKVPGVDDHFVTGGYYDEAYVRTAGGWKIQRLYEDNRYLKAPPM